MLLLCLDLFFAFEFLIFGERPRDHRHNNVRVNRGNLIGPQHKRDLLKLQRDHKSADVNVSACLDGPLLRNIAILGFGL